MTKTPPEDLTDAELDGLEYHGCSSGTTASPMVRDAIVRACAEIRRHRHRVTDPDPTRRPCPACSAPSSVTFTREEERFP